MSASAEQISKFHDAFYTYKQNTSTEYKLLHLKDMDGAATRRQDRADLIDLLVEEIKTPMDPTLLVGVSTVLCNNLSVSNNKDDDFFPDVVKNLLQLAKSSNDDAGNIMYDTLAKKLDVAAEYYWQPEAGWARVAHDVFANMNTKSTKQGGQIHLLQALSENLHNSVLSETEAAQVKNDALAALDQYKETEAELLASGDLKRMQNHYSAMSSILSCAVK